MGLFTVNKTEAKTIIIEQLRDEVEADGTISAEANTVRIVFDGTDQYYFEFDDTAFDNNSALSGSADTALQAVIDAHTPASEPPTEPPINGSKTKSGRIASGSFSGSPMVASVTYNYPYETYENTVVICTCKMSNNKIMVPTITAHDNTGFTVSLGTSSASNLVELCWMAMVEGEET